MSQDLANFSVIFILFYYDILHMFVAPFEQSFKQNVFEKHLNFCQLT